MPFPKPRNRSRRSSQSSNLSRDNSVDRGSNFQRSYRSHSGNRYNSSRDNSVEGRPYRSSTNWRSLPRADPNLDTEIAEMSRKFTESVELNKTPGVLVLPSSTELVKKVMSDHQYQQHQQQPFESDRMVNGSDSVAKQLFDPRNPDKPITVSVNQRLQRDFHTRDRGNTNQMAINHEAEGQDSKDKRKKRSNRSSQSLENASSQPVWYDQESVEYKRAHNPKLIEQIVRIDHELHKIVMSSELFRVSYRFFLSILR